MDINAAGSKVDIGYSQATDLAGAQTMDEAQQRQAIITCGIGTAIGGFK
jgi:hypothetical protein